MLVKCGYPEKEIIRKGNIFFIFFDNVKKREHEHGLLLEKAHFILAVVLYLYKRAKKSDTSKFVLYYNYVTAITVGILYACYIFVVYFILDILIIVYA